MSDLDPIINFLIYLVSGTAYFVFFIWVYLKLTPYDDFALIRQGNSAAAISLAGSLLGFALPLVHAIEQSASLTDLLIWAVITMLVQIVTYLVVKKIFPDLVKQIPNDRNGEAIFLASVSIVMGLITSASMTA